MILISRFRLPTGRQGGETISIWLRMGLRDHRSQLFFLTKVQNSFKVKFSVNVNANFTPMNKLDLISYVNQLIVILRPSRPGLVFGEIAPVNPCPVGGASVPNQIFGFQRKEDNWDGRNG